MAIGWIAGAGAFAAKPRLVIDLESTPAPPARFEGNQILSTDESAIFVARAGANAHGVWRTDGTIEGTRQLVDIPVSDEVALLGITSDGMAFFSTQERSRFHQKNLLWRTAGTPDSTYPVFRAPLWDSVVAPILLEDSPANRPPWLFFLVQRVDQSVELWRTDGSVEGNVKLLTVEPDYGLDGRIPVISWGSNQGFFALEGVTPGLFATDGSAAGTKRLFEGAVRLIRQQGTDAFFSAQEELWFTNGTVAGTHPVADFTASDSFRYVGGGVLGDEGLYFVATDPNHGREVWMSDGTPEGTRRLTDFPLDDPFGYPAPELATAPGGMAFLATQTGVELSLFLRRTGEAIASEAMVVCLDRYGPWCPLEVGRHRLAIADRGLVFLAITDSLREPWSLDLATGDTQRMASGCTPERCDNFSQFYGAWSGRVLFSRGEEVWLSDGSTGGTFRISGGADGGAALPAPASTPKLFYFGGSVQRGYTVIAASATPDSAVEIDRPQLTLANDPRGLAALGSDLIFHAFEENRWRFWKTRGIANATVPLEDECAGTICGRGPGPVPANVVGARYFATWNSGEFFGDEVWVIPSGSSRAHRAYVAEGGIRLVPGGFQGRQLFADRNGFWTSDGSEGGTTRLFPPVEGLGVDAARAFGDRFLFETSAALWSYWRTDAAPTRLMSQVYDTPGEVGFARLGRRILFNHGAEGGTRLFASDDPNGAPVALWSLPASSQPVVAAGKAWWVGGGSPGSFAIVRSDGTPPGSVAVASIPDGGPYSDGVSTVLVPFAKGLLFAVDDGILGSEPWISNGTPAGTRPIADLAPGFFGSSPKSFTAVADGAYFVAYDPWHGAELWWTDGTPRGTRRMGDLCPGPCSSEPRDLTLVGEQLYFSADDGLRGRELWTVPAPPRGSARTP